MHQHAWNALADPTRRRVVELLAERDRTAGELAGEFPISGPAMSRHLRVLREADVVSARVDAQRRIYHLEARAIDDVRAWCDEVTAFWNQRLDALETEIRRGKGTT